MPTTPERPIVIDIVDLDGTGHVYVHGVGTDGNRVMSLSRDGRQWTVERYEGGTLSARNLPDLVYRLADAYAATVCRAGVAVIDHEEWPANSMRVPLAFVCEACDRPATRVDDSNDALCQADAREHYGAEWRAVTRALSPVKAERYARTGRFERV